MSRIALPVRRVPRGRPVRPRAGRRADPAAVAWADYFGRANFGAIRGVALSAQVLAQAAGPLIAGVLRDLTGDYRAALYCFATLAMLSAAVALAARRPRELEIP